MKPKGFYLLNGEETFKKNLGITKLITPVLDLVSVSCGMMLKNKKSQGN